MNLHGKIVLITGASYGIGDATARAIAREGASVILAARSAEKLNQIALQIGIDKTLAVPADITQIHEIENLVSQALSRFKKIDILINNAGVGLSAPIHRMIIDDFKKLFEINVIAPVMLIQAVIPVMRKGGGGKIINVSSMITRVVTPGSGGYRTSKLALNGISDAARYELKKDNIQVVTVLPGLTDTNFYRHSIGAKATNNTCTTNRKGRSPEFVAQKIITAIKRDQREIYMSFGSFIGGKFAQLFPGLTERLITLKK